jgi:arylsulfatase A-like enzyme
MKKIKQHPSLFFFTVYFIILSYYEFLLRYFTLNNSLSLMPFVFNLLFALFLTVLTRMVKANRIMFYGLMIFVGIVYASQIYYYFFFSTFYIAYSFLRAGMVAGNYYREIMTLILKNLHILLLIFLPILMLVYFRKSIKVTRWTLKETAMGFMLFVICYGLTVFQVSLRDKDDGVYDAYIYHPEVVESVNQLGMLSSFSVDVTRLVKESLGLTNETRLPEEVEEEPEKPSGFISNSLDIPFETLIANETNPIIKEMHEYFFKHNPTKQNKKTGLYKDYNLIVITAETFSRWAVREDLTPTLYKLVHEGYYFTNFYTPLWTVSTLDAEYVGFTSLIPKSGVWSLNKTSTNDMSFVLGHQMKALGYTTFAFHNNIYTYYKRQMSHPNLGFTYLGVGNGLTDTGEWPQSDLDMMKETIPMFINEDKFHIYYMTVSGHSNYWWDQNSMSMKNRDLVKNLPYVEYVKGYLAAHIELDRAVAYLLDELNKAGKLDNTLIVLSADHYPYNMYPETLANMNEGVPVESEFDIYRSPLIIYNPKIVSETITRPVSSLDLLPTISNLMGLEFDSRLMMGIDMFSNTEPLVIFKDKSFITSAGKYNAKIKEFIYNEGVIVNDAYVERMIQIVNAKFYYSQKFLENDYYKIISESLK